MATPKAKHLDLSLKKETVSATVVKVEGNCPVMHEGDSYVIENQELPLDRIHNSSGKLCYHALVNMYGGMMLLRGRKPGTKMLNQCIDPGEPFNPGAGRVIFELEVLGEEQVGDT